MEDEYWLKCGFKENGELVCVRMISNTKPDETFFYGENGNYKQALNTRVLKLTPTVFEKISIVETQNEK